MRHLHSQFHFRHTLFALQGPDGYVEALMESARGSATRAAASPLRRAPVRPAAGAAEVRSIARWR